MSRRRRIAGDLARQRSLILYSMAVEETKRRNYKYARMLTDLMLRICRANRVRLPRRIKRGICKNCNIPLIPGVTARYRLRRDGTTSRLVIVCLLCGWIHRYPYRVNRNVGAKEAEGKSPAGEG